MAGAAWNEVHDLAEQLEHIESDDLVKRLEAFLGSPSVDPHGDPIPDENGKVKKIKTQPLTDVTFRFAFSSLINILLLLLFLFWFFFLCELTSKLCINLQPGCREHINV